MTKSLSFDIAFRIDPQLLPVTYHLHCAPLAGLVDSDAPQPVQYFRCRMAMPILADPDHGHNRRHCCYECAVVSSLLPWCDTVRHRAAQIYTAGQ